MNYLEKWGLEKYWDLILRKFNEWFPDTDWAEIGLWLGSLFLILICFFGIRRFMTRKKEFNPWTDAPPDVMPEVERPKAKAPVDKNTKGQMMSEEARKKILNRTSTAAPIPQKEMKITDNTREEITGVIKNVRSIETLEVNPHTGPIDVSGLQESGIIEDMVHEMVSKVSSEDTDIGKYSKMTIEAPLIFDEEEASKKGNEK